MIKDGNFAGLLKTLKEIGVDTIELCSPIGYAEFAPLCRWKAGEDRSSPITASPVRVLTSAWGAAGETGESLAWAKDVGITQIITATLGAGNTPTLDHVKKAADEYNRIAAVSAKAGLQQGLHNEGFELSMVDGERTYDVLFRLLDPKLVKFQFQMSTISRASSPPSTSPSTPAASSRCTCRTWTSTRSRRHRRQDSRPRPAAACRRAVGKGSIDWVKTFAAAKVAA